MAFLHSTILSALTLEDEEQIQPQLHRRITQSLSDTSKQTAIGNPAAFRRSEQQVSMADTATLSSKEQSRAISDCQTSPSTSMGPEEAFIPPCRARKAVSFATNAMQYTYCHDSKITPNRSTAMPPLEVTAPRVNFQTRTTAPKDKVTTYYNKVAMRTNGQICRCVVDFLEEERREGRSWANSLWVLEAKGRNNGKQHGNQRVKAKGERGNGQFAIWEDSSDGDEDADNSDNDEDEADDEGSSSSDSDSESDEDEPADGPRLNHTPFSEYLATVLAELEAQITSLKFRYPSCNARNRALHRKCDLRLRDAREAVNLQPVRNKLTERDMASCGSVQWVREVEKTVREVVEKLEEYETSLAVDVRADLA